ncbi:hypothetical protein HD806DRAFT_210217 [Xylariaceae sp. AK1471]|nr:hypothetical protein HD806DRAFT_210217 [Xylariaceae sp. AK1471]
MKVEEILTAPFWLVHCDGALQRFEKFGLHCRVESVVLRRDQAKNSKVTEARMSQGLCIGLMKLGLKWSYRHHTARQEWLESDITSQSLLNVTAKHMVYKIDKRNGRCCVHPVRNAGTIVVFDQLGRTLDPAQIRAINAYFGQISRPMSQLAGEKPMNVLARQRSEQKFARCATIQPTVEGFQYFWAQWKEDEKATSVQRVTIETFHSEVEEPIDLDKAVTGGHYEGITQRMKAIAL